VERDIQIKEEAMKAYCPFCEKRVDMYFDNKKYKCSNCGLTLFHYKEGGKLDFLYDDDPPTPHG